MEMTPCDGTAKSEKWCCGNSRTCCSSSPVSIAALFKAQSRLSSSSASSTSSTSTARTSSTTPSPSAQPSSSPSASSSLSDVTIVGIVIGAIAALVLFFTAGFVVARKRKLAADPRASLPMAAAPIYPTSSQETRSASLYTHKVEAMDSQIVEVPAEAAVRGRVQEMP
jgi:hypothetical protein